MADSWKYLSEADLEVEVSDHRLVLPAQKGENSHAYMDGARTSAHLTTG